MKMATTYSVMTRNLFDIIIVAAPDKDLWYWPIKVKELESAGNRCKPP